METIGNRILQIRKDSGLNQSDFAQKLGVVTQSTISVLEVGVNVNPTYDTICAICQKFNVRSQWLLFGLGAIYTKESDIDLNTKELIEYQRKEIAHLKQQIHSFLSENAK